MSDKDLSTAILDTASPNTFIVTSSIHINQAQCAVHPSKAEKLDFFSGDPIKIKGKVRRELLLLVHLDDKLRPDEIGLTKEAKMNLRVSNGDTVKAYDVENIPYLVSVTINPVKNKANYDVEELYKLVLPYISELGGLGLTENQLFHYNKFDTDILFKVTAMSDAKGEVKFGMISNPEAQVHCGDAIESKEVEETLSKIGYDNVGGCRKQMAQIREFVELPLKHPKLYERLGVKPPKGILLYGPPGTGKTLIAQAIANETGGELIIINGPEIMSKMAGESESNLRKAFEHAEAKAPSIIFMDEIDSIAPKREKTQGEVERRIVSQLLTLMDGMKARSSVIVIGATNRPNSIDPALRRFGRFDREIEIGIPDAYGRAEILSIHTKNMTLHDNVKLLEIAEEIHGYVGSDIASLCSEAALQQIREKLPMIDLDADKISADVLNSLMVTKENFQYAIQNTDPSSLRETVVEVPNVSWADIGGLENVKKELRETVQFPIDHAEKFLALGMNPSKGVLFYGPPGCGKTLLAKAIASQCKANFISVKGPELITMWVGESEANIREIFDKARAAAPCVIFFDELDSIAKARSSNAGDSGAMDRVINQMLSEMDGMNTKKNVFVIGATNRPDQIDPALMRPGRLDQLVYIPLPDLESRLSILKSCTRKTPLNKDFCIKTLAAKTEGFSGADLNEICQRACKIAIGEWVKEEEERNKDGNKDETVSLKRELCYKHFEVALKNARKSVNDSEIKRYENFNRSSKLDSKQSNVSLKRKDKNADDNDSGFEEGNDDGDDLYQD